MHSHHIFTPHIHTTHSHQKWNSPKFLYYSPFHTKLIKGNSLIHIPFHTIHSHCNFTLRITKMYTKYSSMNSRDTNSHSRHKLTFTVQCIHIHIHIHINDHSGRSRKAKMLWTAMINTLYYVCISCVLEMYSMCISVYQCVSVERQQVIHLIRSITCIKLY